MFKLMDKKIIEILSKFVLLNGPYVCPSSVICPSVNNLLQTTSPKPLGGISPTFTGMILGWSLFKFVQKITFLCRILVAMAKKGKAFKILSKTTGQNNLVQNSPSVALYQSCSNYFDWLKNMVARGRGVVSFSCADTGKTLKIFLSEIKRPRDLIIGMVHNLMDLHQVNLTYAPRANKGSRVFRKTWKKLHV